MYTYRHPRYRYPPNHPAFFFLSLCCSCCFVLCVSVRSAAPDFHKLNEDGELWLVNQGLKETIRCNCVLNTRVIFEHDPCASSQERMCAAVFLLSHLSSEFSLTSVFLFILGQTVKDCCCCNLTSRLIRTFYRFRGWFLAKFINLHAYILS